MATVIRNRTSGAQPALGTQPAPGAPAFFIQTKEAQETARSLVQLTDATKQLIPDALVAYTNNDVGTWTKLVQDGRIPLYAQTLLVHPAYVKGASGGVKLWVPETNPGDETSVNAIPNAAGHSGTAAGPRITIQTWSLPVLHTDDGYKPGLIVQKQPYIPFKDGARLPACIIPDSLRLHLSLGPVDIDDATKRRTWGSGQDVPFITLTADLLAGSEYATGGGADVAGWAKAVFWVVSVPDSQ